MGRFVNPDNGAFRVALNSKIYVDKTGLIEYTNSVLGTTDAYICNSRPRRFGKSYAANMLAAYYSKGAESWEMFKGLEISKAADFKKHLNKYDVIHIDIQWFLSSCSSADRVVSLITQSVLSELTRLYPEALSRETKALSDALSRINLYNGNKFVIIIDEWDVLIRDETANQHIVDEYICFLRGLFKGIEPTKYIQLAYLTGILPIKREKTQSALNNFNEFTMLSPGRLARYIGFTDEEVYNLALSYSADYEKIKKWYDGYILREYQVYNPRAVVSVIQNEEFKSYWSETASYETIVPLINMDYEGLKTAVIEMLSGASVEVNTASFKNDAAEINSRDEVLTYMIHLGYLGYNQERRASFVPNEEIRQELAIAVNSRPWDEFIKFKTESDELLSATLDMDGERVAAEIEKIHDDFASAIQYSNENSLNSVLTIAYLGAMQYYFKPVRELPTGRGFADFVYIPRPEYRNDYPALVIELKWDKNLQTAMQQIKDKNYPSSILNYTGNILLVGISYDKSSKKHECLIEEYKKD